jgi:oxygen-independent coproporphyrinogen-3 oxidase
MPSLYLHIPFCERKCAYCDFMSVESRARIPQFLESLEREIVLSAPLGEGVLFDTVFFGGGTPSLLPPEAIVRILEQLGSAYAIDSCAEITLEANPGTTTAPRLRGYRDAGVNRLSIGVQSFRDEELRFLGRIHGSDEARRAVGEARAAGFANVSIDLIYGLPGQTAADWRSTLEGAIALAPDHISAYNLIVEEGTPLGRKVRAGSVTPNSPDVDAGLASLTGSVLADAGFEQYEISNHARPGFRSRHNLAYWTHEPYLGFGPSSHSFWRDRGAPLGRRWWNTADLRDYGDRLASGGRPVAGEECLTRHEAVVERVFLGLRSVGVDLSRMEAEFGWSPDPGEESILAAVLRASHATLHRGVLRLTRSGYLLCDEIAARLLPPTIPVSP